MEYYVLCNACGKGFVYSDADLKKQLGDSVSGLFTGIAQMGAALSGNVVTGMAAKMYSPEIRDFKKCPHCGSTNLRHVSLEEFQRSQRPAEIGNVRVESNTGDHQADIQNLSRLVQNLPNEFSRVLDQKLQYILDSLYPIPAVLEMNAPEAKEIITTSGLHPIINCQDDVTEETGVIVSVQRSKQSFMNVELGVGLAVPSVVGMNLQSALMALKEAGFEAEVVYTIVVGHEKDQVLGCHRSLDNSKHIVLEVSRLLESRTMIFCKAIQGCTRFSEIKALWKECELEGDPAFNEIETDLLRRAEIEYRYGAHHDIEYMKDYINKLEERISAIDLQN